MPFNFVYLQWPRDLIILNNRVLELVFQLFPSMLAQPLSALILNTYSQGKESEGWARPVGSHRGSWGSGFQTEVFI